MEEAKIVAGEAAATKASEGAKKTAEEEANKAAEDKHSSEQTIPTAINLIPHITKDKQKLNKTPHIKQDKQKLHATRIETIYLTPEDETKPRNPTTWAKIIKNE